MRSLQRVGIVVLWGILCWGKAELWAFDNDRTINTPDFLEENFMDIKSYQLRKSLDDQWHETDKGWRSVFGSLGPDLMYVLLELRFRQPVSKILTVSYELQQEGFYAPKPVRQLLDFQFHLGGPYHVSFIGMPFYDKRSADLGMALTLGTRPWNYLRVSHLEQDVYYNEKNFEEDRYETEPVEDQWEGAYRFSPKWRGRFRFRQDRAMEQSFPLKGLTFKHKGLEGQAILDYHYAERSLVGTRYRGFDFRKSHLNPTSPSPRQHRKQHVQYLSHEVYWIRPVAKDELTLGGQLDRFGNRLRDLNDVNKSFNYLMETWQAYGIWLQRWKRDMNWEYGFYLGQVHESEKHLTGVRQDKGGKKMEAKLRVSWEWFSPDNKSTVLLSSTWNIDSIPKDFWDGGALGYQTTF